MNPTRIILAEGNNSSIIQNWAFNDKDYQWTDGGTKRFTPDFDFIFFEIDESEKKVHFSSMPTVCGVEVEGWESFCKKEGIEYKKKKSKANEFSELYKNTGLMVLPLEVENNKFDRRLLLID